MRVICLHIPKGPSGAAAAVYVTKWELFNSKFFLHQLDELAESIWEPFSLEFYCMGKNIYCCMAGSDEMIDVLTTGVYSWLKDSQIEDIEDYTETLGNNRLVAGLDLRLWRPDIYPIQDYRSFNTDSLVPVVMAIQQIPEGDGALLQVIVRPIEDSAWTHLRLSKAIATEKYARCFRARNWFNRDVAPKDMQAIKEKCGSRLFWVNYRITAFTNDPGKHDPTGRRAAHERVVRHAQSIANACKAYNLSDQNRFELGKIESGGAYLTKVHERRFVRPFRLSSIELTSIFHPPSLGVVPNTAQVLSKKAPPPPLLPTQSSDPSIGAFAHTNYRDHEIHFGIKRADRRKHLYVLGKSGSGKSCLLQLLVRDDIERGFGCAVLDPHGDLIDDILRLIPRQRINDVILFDPSQRDFAPSFNPMAPIRPDLKLRVAMSFLDSFKRVFGADWSERMDHVLRYAVLGLVSVPGCNLVSLRKMLSDDAYRGEIVRQARDESVKRFWLREFAARRKDFVEGPISRLLNRLDELLATETMRHILGQHDNRFNFREFMDNHKIVLLKISKGTLGSDNASLLGSLLVWKIYEAAMSRADIPVENRQDFYFYIDEFQNFATDSFGEILSEARKYNLSLTLANQYLSQLPGSVRQTIFGNIANILSFRLGADDAATLASEFAPEFDDSDLMNLPIRDFYLKMSIDGQINNSFSGRTLDLEYPSNGEELSKQCVRASLKKYCVQINKASEQKAST